MRNPASGFKQGIITKNHLVCWEITSNAENGALTRAGDCKQTKDNPVIFSVFVLGFLEVTQVPKQRVQIYMEVLCRDVRYDTRPIEDPCTSGAAAEDQVG